MSLDILKEMNRKTLIGELLMSGGIMGDASIKPPRP